MKGYRGRSRGKNISQYSSKTHLQRTNADEMGKKCFISECLSLCSITSSEGEVICFINMMFILIMAENVEINGIHFVI